MIFLFSYKPSFDHLNPYYNLMKHLQDQKRDGPLFIDTRQKGVPDYLLV